MAISTIVTSVIVVLMMIISTITVIYCEKENFNNGICPKCGKKLRLFNIDSKGCRIYDCLHCDYTTHCTYNVDKNYK